MRSRAGAPEFGQVVKRVFDMDIEHCPNCGGSLKRRRPFDEAQGRPSKNSPVIVKILAHLGLAHPRPATLPCAAIRFIPTI